MKIRDHAKNLREADWSESDLDALASAFADALDDVAGEIESPRLPRALREQVARGEFRGGSFAGTRRRAAADLLAKNLRERLEAIVEAETEALEDVHRLCAHEDTPPGLQALLEAVHYGRQELEAQKRGV